MSNDSNPSKETTDSGEQSTTLANQVTSTYKVLGQLSADNGVGVLGQNDAESGTPIGIEGAVPNSSTGYGLSTPDDARVEGTLATTGSAWVKIDGNLNISHGGDKDSGRAGNVVMGHSSNGTTNGGGTITPFVNGATIAGGGYDDGTSADPNLVYDDFGTVGGGRDNTAGSPDGDVTTAEYATVSGGLFNDASGGRSTVGGGGQNTASDYGATVSGGSQNTASDGKAVVGGGEENTASGTRSVVPGGLNNAASEPQSYAAGMRARAESNASFVWNDGAKYHDTEGDSDDDGFSSDKDVAGSGVHGSRTFHIGARNGVRIVTGSNSVTYISGSSTGWSTTSTRSAKTNFEAVDTESVLAGVNAMDVSTWEYKDEDDEGCGERHIGPVAEQFHDVVDVGNGDDHINSINADGVLFAAIQGLSHQLEQKEERIDELENRLAAVEKHLDHDESADADLSGTNESAESEPVSDAS